MHGSTGQLIRKYTANDLTAAHRQDGQQAIAETVGLLVAALQPDTRVAADLAAIQLNAVVTAGGPDSLTGRPQAADLLQQLLVGIALVSRRHHQRVHLEDLLAVTLLD